MRIADSFLRSLEVWAIRLRRLPWFHRAAKWLRATFWNACREAVLEFSRILWANSEHFGPPSRTFSVYQALRTGVPKTTGRIVTHDQGCPAVTEDSLVVTGGYNQHNEQPWAVFWSEHRHARLVTESLALLGDGKRVCMESIYGNPRFRMDPAFRFFRLPPPTRLAGNWTSLVSRWVATHDPVRDYPCYTHWILDALPRLALLGEFPADTRIIIPPGLHRYQLESLTLLGLQDRCRPTPERHLEVDRYFFSSPTAMLQGYNPYGLAFLRQAFLPKADITYSGPKRFFIRRVGLCREPRNLAAVEAFFQDRGWVGIDVMRLNLAQQIRLFSEAESVVGMFGSGFTNCVFCPPGCDVIAIMPEEFGLDGFLEWIGQLIGYRWHPLIISASYSYDFSVDLKRVKDWLLSEGLLRA